MFPLLLLVNVRNIAYLMSDVLFLTTGCKAVRMIAILKMEQRSQKDILT